MNKWKAIAGILLIFILGGLVGSLGTGMVVKQRIKRFADPKRPPPPIYFLQRQLRQMSLSADQEGKITPILDRMHAGFLALLEKSRPEFDRLFDSHVQEIREQLDASQQEQLDATVQKIKAHLERLHSPGSMQKDGESLLSALKTELDLTPDQAKTSQAIIQDMHKRMETIRERFGREKGLLRERFADDMEKEYQNAEKALSKVLTAGQMDILQKKGDLKDF
ncbi:MAG: hypothetical protein KQI81_19390 [Deltaproteobacteria bacterium]|nr:hypothetical protein [Deltaproteobacteria bacterium]